MVASGVLTSTDASAGSQPPSVSGASASASALAGLAPVVAAGVVKHSEDLGVVGTAGFVSVPEKVPSSGSENMASVPRLGQTKLVGAPDSVSPEFVSSASAAGSSPSQVVAVLAVSVESAPGATGEGSASVEGVSGSASGPAQAVLAPASPVTPARRYMNRITFGITEGSTMCVQVVIVVGIHLPL